MIRKIKFRGKRVDNGEWVYGYFCISPKTGFYLVADLSLLEWYRVEPETVGQYTNLDDWEGKEIYEADIISLPTYYETPEMSSNPSVYWRVVIENGRTTIVNSANPSSDLEEHLAYTMFQYDQNIKVAGNIYENFDLLDQ